MFGLRSPGSRVRPFVSARGVAVRSVSAVVVAVMVVTAMVATGCAPTSAGVWRGADCGSPPTLAAGASLYGCNLAGLDLSGIDLSGANLAGANLSNSNLSNANLTGADLEGANLTGANLTNANLSGAILSGAILIGALFIGAALTGTTFDFGRAFGAGGLGAGSPSGSSCTGALCPGYNEATVDDGHPICNADLASVGFFVHRSTSELAAAGDRSVVTSDGTSFAGAVFDYSNDVAVTKLRAFSLGSADFTGATFINASFACQNSPGARLSGSSFQSTGVGGLATHFYDMAMQGSDLSDSEIFGAVFNSVDLSGSNFDGAVISAAALEVPDLFPAEVNADLPYYLLNLDNTSFQDARIGVDPNPSTGSVGMQLGIEANGLTYATAWANADFANATVGGMAANHIDLSGASATGATVSGAGSFVGASFLGGWGGSTWIGGFDFSSAICPDGSIGSAAHACF